VCVDADAQLLRELADMDRDVEPLRRLAGVVDRVVDPPLPRAIRRDEHELSVVQTDPNDDAFGIRSVVGDVIARMAQASAGSGFRHVLERPRARHQITSPPSTHSTCPVM
jgi:hypothetical protein